MDQNKILEDPNNIMVVCRAHHKKLFPTKRFTKGQLKYAKYIKAEFRENKSSPREHMWLRIISLEENHVVGSLANIPVFTPSLKYGDIIKVKYEDVEDAI